MNSLQIGALPWVHFVDTSAATVDPVDPVPSCSIINDRNVWYVYTAPPSGISLEILTAGSDYDTVISVYDGACAVLDETACTVDTPAGTGDSQIIVSIAGNQTVRIQVSSDTGTGGNLELTAQEAVPPILSSKGYSEVIRSTYPSPLGGDFGHLGTAVALTPRHIGFSSTTEGIFAHTAMGLVTIAVSGTVSPVGGKFERFGPPVINDNGTIAFYARLDRAGIRSGIFEYSGGVLTARVVAGDPAPLIGNYTDFRKHVALNNAGDLVFMADTTFFPQTDLIVDNVGGATVLATEGFNSPCGGTIRRIGSSRASGFALADGGQDVAFWASSTGGDDGVIHSAGGTLTAIACENAPTLLGGTYRRVGEQPAIDDNGLVWFASEVVGGAITGAVWRGGVGIGPAPIVSEGAVLVTGETLQSVSKRADLRVRGASTHYAFVAQLDGGVDGVVTFGPTLAGPSVVATEGDPCGVGGTLDAIDLTGLYLASNGGMSFEGACSTGQGVFLASPAGAVTTVATTADATAIGAGFDFIDPSIDASQNMAFRGERVGLYATRCSGVNCAPFSTLAAAPLALPGLPGQTIDAIKPLTLNGLGKRQAALVESAGAGGRFTSVLFVNRGQADVIASVGDTLPNGQGEYAAIPDADGFGNLAMPSLGKKGVAFLAEFTGHPTGADSGIVFVGGNTSDEIAVAGGLSPTGGTFEEFYAPIVRKKSVVFRARTNSDDCIYLLERPGQPLLPIVCDGDPGPALTGGTIGLEAVPANGVPRSVYFAVTLNGGTVSQCLLRWNNGLIEPVRCTGDAYANGGFQFDIFGLPTRTTPASEIKGKGFVQMGVIEYPLPRFGVLSVFASRRDAYFPLFEPNVSTGPVTGEILLYAAEAPPSMNKKTIVFVSDLAGTALNTAVFKAVLP